jgi:hypothetical protein
MAEQPKVVEGVLLDTPAHSVTNTIEICREMFADGFKRKGRGERIWFEVSMMALPGDPEPPAPNLNPEERAEYLRTAEPQWTTILLLYVETMGATPGTRIYKSWQLAPHAWDGDQDKVDTVVGQVLAQLLQGRSEQLEAMESQAMNAAEKGRSAPANGVIPGGGLFAQ